MPSFALVHNTCLPVLTVFGLLQEVRAYVALNDSQLVANRLNDTDAQEIWGYYPDDWPLKGLHAGDSRAALTPFLAHEVQPFASQRVLFIRVFWFSIIPAFSLLVSFGACTFQGFQCQIYMSAVLHVCHRQTMKIHRLHESMPAFLVSRLR